MVLTYTSGDSGSEIQLQIDNTDSETSYDSDEIYLQFNTSSGVEVYDVSGARETSNGKWGFLVPLDAGSKVNLHYRVRRSSDREEIQMDEIGVELCCNGGVIDDAAFTVRG